MQSGHDDTTGQFCGAQMERGTEHFGCLRRTGHPLCVGDKERGTLLVRSKTFGTDGPERQPYKVVKSAVTTTQLAAEGGATLMIAALRRSKNSTSKNWPKLKLAEVEFWEDQSWEEPEEAELPDDD